MRKTWFHDWVKSIGMLLLLSCMLLMVGCIFTTPNPQRELTPQDIVAGMYETYNAQYADYMTVMGYRLLDDKWVEYREPVLTEDQRKILVKKKEILTRVYPMIKTYNALVVSGGTLPPTLATEIANELNALVVLLL